MKQATHLHMINFSGIVYNENSHNFNLYMKFWGTDKVWLTTTSLSISCYF